MSHSVPQAANLRWHQPAITRAEREALNRHKGAVIWFTGLSGAGKSTLAHAVEERLYRQGCRTFVLDGDNIRHGLCSDLGFSPQAREENIRRVGELAKLFMEAGTIVLTAFISPYRIDRERARSMVPHGDFVEVYCNSAIEVCEQRDVKGLYKKARAGLIPHFTGISSPYEPPLKPELVVDTGGEALNSCVTQVLAALEEHGIIPPCGIKTPVVTNAPAPLDVHNDPV